MLIAVDMQTSRATGGCSTGTTTWSKACASRRCRSRARSSGTGSPSVLRSMPTATVLNGPCTCRPARRRTDRGDGRPACGCQPVRVGAVRAAARRCRAPGAARLFDHGPQRPGSGRVPPDPPTDPRAGLPLRRWPHSDQRPPSGARMRARWVCRVPGTGLIPTGRRPMRSNASPEAALSVLAACLLEAAWISLVYVTAEHLAGAAAAPLSLLAFAGAALIGVGFARASGPARSTCLSDDARRDRRRRGRPRLVAAVGACGGSGPRRAGVGLRHAPRRDPSRACRASRVRTHDRSRRRTDRGNRARTGPGGHRRPLGAPDGDRRDE